MPRIDPRFGAGKSGDSLAAADGVPAGGEEAEVLPLDVPIVQGVARTLAAAPTVVMLEPSTSVAAERFRRLKTRIVNEYKEASQVIVITSAAPREGKSFVALNLALAFAADPGQTVLIDADLRRPTVHRLMSPEPGIGVGEVLKGSASLGHALVRLKNTALRVLPGVRPEANPVDLIASDACKQLVATLRKSYQRVIIDTPPVIPFTDADAIGALADGVLLVVRAGVTPRLDVTQALSMITSARVLGMVFNDVTYSLADHGHYHNYNYYHTYYDKKPSE